MQKLSESKIKILLLFAFPMLNLLFMHYFFYFSELLEWTWLYSEVINLCSVVFDVAVLTIVFLICTCGRMKPAIAMTQFVTLIWSFVNVMYGKFFFQYMSLTAIGEAHGLGEGLVINSMMSAFYWYDLYFLVSAILFIFVYNRVVSFKINRKKVYSLLLISISSIMMTFMVYSTYHFIHPHFRNNWKLYTFRAKEFLYDSVRGGTPNLVHFQTGCIRVAIYELYDMFHVTELSAEQKSQIETYYQDHSHRTTHHSRNPKIKNVIFILLESFLSTPIDLVVDGKEITPFLNSLKRDSDVYYNGNMISDIGCGESGDGQFIYMTGILPLKYKMTVGQVKNNVLPALPKVLNEEMNIHYSEIISPTVPNLWQQSEMNKAYGFSNAYWLEDIVSGQSKQIDDSLIFKFASRKLEKKKEPFMSLILSLSTHSPYTKHAGEDYLKGNKCYNELYNNYLNSCHYLDAQLKLFFDSLKEKELYDNSLIVIASDHYAHLDMLNMKKQLSSNTPLFIINGGIDTSKTWKGVFHQLDLYTSLFDILAIRRLWMGLGHTIITTNYVQSVDYTTYKISDMIINSDYFNDK